MFTFNLKAKLIAFGAGLLAILGVLASVYKAGGNKQINKQLKRENKANDKINKNRKAVASMSDDDINSELLDS